MLKLIWNFMAEAIVLVVTNVTDVISIMKADECGFTSPTPLTFSWVDFFFGFSRIIAVVGWFFAFIALLVMGHIAECFKCILALPVGVFLYSKCQRIISFLLTPALYKGNVDDPVGIWQVMATIIWRLYFMLVLAVWCDLTIWGYFRVPVEGQETFLRMVYLVACIAIPGSLILRHSVLLRRMALSGSKMAGAMHVGYETTFFAHVLACYAAYSGEQMIAVLCIIPLMQILAFVITTTNPKEQAEGIVQELRKAALTKELEENSATDTNGETDGT